MEKNVNIFHTPYLLAEKFAEEFVNWAAQSEKGSFPFCVALSGGSTPELLYSVIGDHFSKSVKWENVHFFWGDERCVSPGSPESNYGMTVRSLLGKIRIPESNIHRIKGESDPEKEAVHYSGEITDRLRQAGGMPVFDLIILGVGEDGHTASIFPYNNFLLESESTCAVASHPVTMQKRITITGRVINNAERVAFLVTGRQKAAVVEKILNKRSSGQNFPASGIVPVNGELLWFLDKDAASML
ncbi:MAG: 6-phosphogluconolactonase [Bacteroidales bacterium]|nr:6-phosphogluconolactonase [Bacteroidales bacterium]